MDFEKTEKTDNFNFKDYRFVEKIILTDNLDIALMQGITQPVTFALLVNASSGATPAFMSFDEKGRVYNVGHGRGWEHYTDIEYCTISNRYGWVYPKTGIFQPFLLNTIPSHRQIQEIKLLIAETFLLDIFTTIKDEFMLRFK